MGSLMSYTTIKVVLAISYLYHGTAHLCLIKRKTRCKRLMEDAKSTHRRFCDTGSVLLEVMLRGRADYDADGEKS
eukprot:7566581-Pyramimonas_sp.AAC.1